MNSSGGERRVRSRSRSDSGEKKRPRYFNNNEGTHISMLNKKTLLASHAIFLVFFL